MKHETDRRSAAKDGLTSPVEPEPENDSSWVDVVPPEQLQPQVDLRHVGVRERVRSKELDTGIPHAV